MPPKKLFRRYPRQIRNRPCRWRRQRSWRRRHIPSPSLRILRIFCVLCVPFPFFMPPKFERTQLEFFSPGGIDKTRKIWIMRNTNLDVQLSLVRAPCSHRGGQQFESVNVHLDALRFIARLFSFLQKPLIFRDLRHSIRFALQSRIIQNPNLHGALWCVSCMSA